MAELFEGGDIYMALHDGEAEAGVEVLQVCPGRGQQDCCDWFSRLTGTEMDATVLTGAPSWIGSTLRKRWIHSQAHNGTESIGHKLTFVDRKKKRNVPGGYNASHVFCRS